MKSRVYLMTTWYVFATSKSYPAIGHVSEVENPPLRFSDVKHLKLKELWHGATKTEFNGLVNLKVFTFGVKVPRASNVVSARWVFTWKVDKAGCVIKPKASLAGRGFLTQGKQFFFFPSIYLYHLDWYVGTQITSIGDLCCDAGRVFVFLLTRVTVDIIYEI